MTYDLSRFSPQSFERFVQALSECVFGPGLRIYGIGRDGAREATFDGTCAIGKGDWTGYVVIQAKYHVLSEAPSKNLVWLEGSN
jgi:hypothetical protein